MIGIMLNIAGVALMQLSNSWGRFHDEPGRSR